MTTPGVLIAVCLASQSTSAQVVFVQGQLAGWYRQTVTALLRVTGRLASQSLTAVLNRDLTG